jgi:hypothetical protein
MYSLYVLQSTVLRYTITYTLMLRPLCILICKPTTSLRSQASGHATFYAIFQVGLKKISFLFPAILSLLLHSHSACYLTSFAWMRSLMERSRQPAGLRRPNLQKTRFQRNGDHAYRLLPSYGTSLLAHFYTWTRRTTRNEMPRRLCYGCPCCLSLSSFVLRFSLCR